MTDRRPHWDDDLLTAVHAAVANDHFYFTTDQVYDVIAAVEDWLGPVEEMVNDGERVQRVRELHHSKLDRHPQGDVQRCIACLDLWPCPTIRAIEGGSDE